MTEIHINDPQPFDDDIAVEKSLRPNNMDEFISQDDPTLGTFEEWIDMTIDNARVEAEAHRRAVAEAAAAAAAAMARSHSK